MMRGVLPGPLVTAPALKVWLLATPLAPMRLRLSSSGNLASFVAIRRDTQVKELNMTALQGWIVIGLLVLILLGIVGIGAEIQALPYLWRTHDVGLLNPST